jgi:transcriptional regulator with XRE-family HTH domain
VLGRARQIARLRQERGWNPAAIATALPVSSEEGFGPLRSGANIRRARRARGLTIREVADRVGVAASTVSALERGEAAVNSALVARLADALLVPMGALASTEAPREAVIRERMRPRTVNAGGVVWEELGAPERALEPALLTVPPGEGSGGSYSRPGETLAFLLEGRLGFELFSGEASELELAPGDAITIPGREVFSWSNSGTDVARALWIECLLVTGA